MAATEASLYAHCPNSNFPLQSPNTEVWVDPHGHPSSIHIGNNETSALASGYSDSSNVQQVIYSSNVLSSTNKRVKARKILDYIRKIIRQQTLCQKHERLLDQSLAELQLSYQMPANAMDTSSSCESRDELGDRTDQALVYSFLQLKKIASCSDCRNRGKTGTDRATPYEDTTTHVGSRVNHAGLIWALLRNWCDVFRTRRANERRTHLKSPLIENFDEVAKPALTKSQLFLPTADCSAEHVDKFSYCWKWLLSQTEPAETKVMNNVRRPSGCLFVTSEDVVNPLFARFAYSSATDSSSSRFHRSTDGLIRLRRHSMSDITDYNLFNPTQTSQPPNSHHDRERHVAVPPMKPVNSRRKCDLLSPARLPETSHIHDDDDDDEATNWSPKPKSARCIHLPHHVTRRPAEDRRTLLYRPPVHGSSSSAFCAPLSSNRIHNSSRTFHSPTIPGANLSGLKIPMEQYSSNSYANCLPNSPREQQGQHEQLVNHPRQQQRKQPTQPYTNLRTIHFLQSLSPNMNVVPPPNHNPFVIKPAVR